MTKTRSNFLVFGKPVIGEEEINEVIDTLKSGWWGTGPKTEKFETLFKKYVGSKYALAVNSGTAAIHLALKALGVGPGDEVITSSLTFCSTANVIIHSGAKPVFADVDLHDWNIDPQDIEKKITKKTKAILPVHLHGRPAKMDKILAIAKKHGLFVVEDAAHAISAQYHKKKIGNIGDLTAFSFYVTKNLATGEGGMVTTNNKKFYEQMKTMRLHGLSHDAYKRYSVKKFTLYECIAPGYKYNLTDLASSIGIHQLKKIKDMQRVRKFVWKYYEKKLSNIPQIVIPAPIDKDIIHSMHIFGILIDKDKLSIDRNTFIDKLIKQNIGSGVHFSAVHLHPYYKKEFGYKKGMLPNAEFIGERIVSLPIAGNLSEKDVSDVVDAVKKIIRTYKK